MRTTLAILTAITLAGCSNDPTATDETEADISSDLRPDGKGALTAEANANKAAMQAVLPAARVTKGNGINYHGGPVMIGTVDIYYIWYGNWGSNTRDDDPARLHLAPRRIAYENINTTYYNGSGTHVSGAISYKGAYSTSAYLGTSLSDAQILQVVSDALSGNHLPNDTNAIYFVLTSKDVNASSGFCTQYCGWHTSGSIVARASTRSSATPIAARRRARSRRRARTATPAPTAWRRSSRTRAKRRSAIPTSTPGTTRKGEENADKCAWTFGTE